MNDPKVSVILPVYNGEKFLYEGIESILSQTYKDFEFIIINDGSNDKSEDIINQFNDSRIHYYRQINQGLASTLNNAIKRSMGMYIARQDQDDFSYPKRFEKQIEYLENHPDYGMVGTWAEIWEGNSKTNLYHRHSSESSILKFCLLFNNPFVHSSMMIRKSVLDDVGLYTIDNLRQPPEDYELWSRISRYYQIANIPEVLHAYRNGLNRMSTNCEIPFIEKIIHISKENIAEALDKSISDQIVIDIAELTHQCFHKLPVCSNLMEISRSLAILKKIYSVTEPINKILTKKVNRLLLSLFPDYIKYTYGEIHSYIPRFIVKAILKIITS